MINITITFTIQTSQQVKIGYRIQGSGSPFIYLPNLLNQTDSPFTISNLPNGTYEIERTVINTDVDCPPVTSVATLQPFTVINTDNPYDVLVHDNTGNVYIVGTYGPPTVTGLLAGQTGTVSPIPTGDNFKIGAYSSAPGVPTAHNDFYLRLTDFNNTVVDINPGSSTLTESIGETTLSGYNISPGYTAEVRRSRYVFAHQVYGDSTPGHLRFTSLTGFFPVTAGTGKYHDSVNGVTSTGGNWDAYDRGFQLNPFTTPNNVLVGISSKDPNGINLGTQTYPYNRPGMFLSNTNTWLLLEESNPNALYGEKFQTLSFADLNLDNNEMVAANAGNPINTNGTAITSISRSGTTLTINWTWSSFDGLNQTNENPQSWDLYIMIVKDHGLSSESVTHVPMTAAWPHFPGGSPTFQYTSTPYSSRPLGSTGTITRTIPIPSSYTTLHAKIYFVAYESSTTVVVNGDATLGSNLGALLSI